MQLRLFLDQPHLGITRPASEVRHPRFDQLDQDAGPPSPLGEEGLSILPALRTYPGLHPPCYRKLHFRAQRQTIRMEARLSSTGNE